MSHQSSVIASYWRTDGWRLIGLGVSTTVLVAAIWLRGPSAPATTTLAPTLAAPPATTAVSTAVIEQAVGGATLTLSIPPDLQPGEPVVLSGSAPPGAIVRVFNGADLIGEARADERGQWQLETSQTWLPGNYSLSVSAVDAAGRPVGTLAPVAVQVPSSALTAAPTATTAAIVGGEEAAATSAAPEAMSAASSAPTGELATAPARELRLTPTAVAFAPPQVAQLPLPAPVSPQPLPWQQASQLSLGAQASIDQTWSGVLSPSNLPVLSGSAPAGAVVRLFDLRRLITEVIAGDDGRWRIDLAGLLPIGDHLLWIEARSPAGDLLAASPPTLLAVAPTSAPIVERPTIGAVVAAARPEVVGRAEPGAAIRVYEDTRLIAEATAGPDGRWQAQPEEPLTPGEHLIRAVVVDAEGRLVGESEPVMVVVPQPARALPVTGGERPQPQLAP